MQNINHPSRRSFIKTTALLTVATATPFYILKGKSMKSNQIIGHGDFTYKVNASWGNLNPENTPVNNCHEMVMDSKDRLIMVTDEVKNNPDH